MAGSKIELKVKHRTFREWGECGCETEYCLPQALVDEILATQNQVYVPEWAEPLDAEEQRRGR